MHYRAVENRCAVYLPSLDLPITAEDALTILTRQGFRMVEVDLIATAKACIGRSNYARGASPQEAPQTVDCSSLMKWLYGQMGIWIPRRSVQQRECGESADLEDLVGGELIFTSGHINYYLNDPSDGIGHVGIFTPDLTVIHAANKKSGVIESPLSTFVRKNKFRGARRYIPLNQQIITLEIPPERYVETEDDIKWLILQSL